MKEFLKPTARRAVLGKGLAVLAGALGYIVIDKKVLAQEPAATGAGGGKTLRLYGRQWPVRGPVRQPGESTVAGSRLLRQGELFARPDGEKVGDFYSSRFCLESSFGLNPFADSNLEFQTFKMRDGMIFGMTTGGLESENEKAHAILAGTGGYAAVRGSYVFSQNREMAGTPGLIEIVLHLTT